MTKGELFERLYDVPEDFQLCLSKYMLVKFNGDGVEEEAVVTDDPIIGIAVSAESKEIRFVRDGSNLDLINEIGDTLALLDGSV